MPLKADNKQNSKECSSRKIKICNTLYSQIIIQEIGQLIMTGFCNIGGKQLYFLNGTVLIIIKALCKVCKLNTFFYPDQFYVLIIRAVHIQLELHFHLQKSFYGFKKTSLYAKFHTTYMLRYIRIPATVQLNRIKSAILVTK